MKNRRQRFWPLLCLTLAWGMGSASAQSAATTDEASRENPLDMTERITNPSFENNFTGWVQSGMQTQSNSDFTQKKGNIYVEKWTASTGSVSDCHVRQEVVNLPAGAYMLKAGAQNLKQSNLSAAQRGVYLVAGDKKTSISSAGEYEVEATVLDGSLTIGFEAVSATGNWVAVDNFRLYYLGSDDQALREMLDALIAEAGAFVGKRMHSAKAEALNSAIDAAKAERDKESTEGYAAVVSSLKESMADAQASIDAYATLQAQVDDASKLLGDGTQPGEDGLKAAIDEANALLATDTSDNDLKAAVLALEKAAFALRIANGTGTVPTVVTGKFVARGSTMAFGRSTITGVTASNLLEKGFCWSTEKEPTVLDNRSSMSYNHNGVIYHMDGLTPSTKYYVRAYAITKEYAVGYGDVVKVITLPKGKIRWSYDNGADAEANARINAAVREAVEDYWNHLTSINGLHANVHYGAGTPTADCSYGGWMRVGPNASYQRTGTIMHELGHAIGVGTHEIWNGGSTPMRSGSGTGTWLGDRVTAVVRFLENNNTATLNGDGTHMWPYGINGAHEDNGTPILYIGNSLITQALGEDGLPPTGGFATPAYVFDQEDTIKYYIKNEDADCGLYSAYLVSNSLGLLTWKNMTAAEAKVDDAAAWYVTFTPDNCYYQVRNASTGKYITYSNGFRTVSRTVPTDSEDLHLMRSRMDVTVGEGSEAVTVRGYWMIHPEAKLNPTCLSAHTSGSVAAATFNLGNSATKQRWVIMQADELEAFETASNKAYLGELDKMIERLQALMDTPHTENAEGTDAAMNSMIASLEAAKTGTSSNTEIASLLAEADEAIRSFLAGATPTDMEQPFDITFFLENTGFDSGEGWSVSPTINHSCGEFYQKSFDMNQTVKSLPAATYQVRVQGYQRPGTSAASYNDYVAGTNKVAAFLHLADKTQKLAHIAVDAQNKKLGGTESTVGTNMYMPNDMKAASIYFAAGFYENCLTVTTTAKRDVRVGIRCGTTSEGYWTIFDNMRLYCYGHIPADDVTGIEEHQLPAALPLFAKPSDIYNIVGIKVRTKATSLEGLPTGIYIVNGKKVVVR